VEPKHNAKFLETKGCEISGWQGDLVLGQILHDLLDPLSILRELGIVCLVSLLNLLYFSCHYMHTLLFLNDRGLTVGPSIDRVWIADHWWQSSAEESFLQAIGASMALNVSRQSQSCSKRGFLDTHNFDR